MGRQSIEDRGYGYGTRVWSSVNTEEGKKRYPFARVLQCPLRLSECAKWKPVDNGEEVQGKGIASGIRRRLLMTPSLVATKHHQWHRSWPSDRKTRPSATRQRRDGEDEQTKSEHCPRRKKGFTDWEVTIEKWSTVFVWNAHSLEHK